MILLQKCKFLGDFFMHLRWPWNAKWAKIATRFPSSQAPPEKYAKTGLGWTTCRRLVLQVHFLSFSVAPAMKNTVQFHFSFSPCFCGLEHSWNPDVYKTVLPVHLFLLSLWVLLSRNLCANGRSSCQSRCRLLHLATSQQVVNLLKFSKSRVWIALPNCQVRLVHWSIHPWVHSPTWYWSETACSPAGLGQEVTSNFKQCFDAKPFTCFSSDLLGFPNTGIVSAQSSTSWQWAVQVLGVQLPLVEVKLCWRSGSFLPLKSYKWL